MLLLEQAQQLGLECDEPNLRQVGQAREPLEWPGIAVELATHGLDAHERLTGRLAPRLDELAEDIQRVAQSTQATTQRPSAAGQLAAALLEHQQRQRQIPAVDGRHIAGLERRE